MCRLAAWLGLPRAIADIVVHPEHSLVSQSQDAQEAKLSVNGDGFGLAWYDGAQDTPGQYRDILPAWSDGNLTSLCRMIKSPLFMAHVRASTMGETARANCHPFTVRNWSFCHNGQIPAMPSLRRGLEAALPDPLYLHRRGTTDSELLFLTLLANGFEQDPVNALQHTLSSIAPPKDQPANKATCLLSDGTRIYGLRYSSHGRAPTLYIKSDPVGWVIASEPLDSDTSKWSAIPQDHFFELSMERGLRLFALNDAQAA